MVGTWMILLRSEATLKQAVRFSGIGVHNGLRSNIRVMPCTAGSGITFKRVDVQGKDPCIQINPEAVVDATMCTRISNRNGVTVAVIEHLLAALRICGITNAEVEVDADEVPIMDGSAIEFVRAFKKCGIKYQNAFVPAIVVSKPVSVSYKNTEISIVPADKSEFHVELDYERINPVISRNKCYEFTFDDDLTGVACARTFGWLADCEKLYEMGLAKGASEENTVVITDDNTIKNEGGLRNPKEIVMHKCLDMIGDISVIGYDIIGRIEAKNPSHFANNLLMRKLLGELDEHGVIVAEPETENRFVQFA